MVVTEDTPSKPKGISIQLSPRARAIVESVRRETGVPNTEAVTRILEWWASFDRKLRIAVLNHDLETRRELIRLTLAEWESDLGADIYSVTEGGRTGLDEAKPAPHPPPTEGHNKPESGAKPPSRRK